ncbi:MAG: hypothetical protein JXB38_03620, partial [Anaerolineales bacterium]|nr:hypothetical protein [Anaerolineales bacterium]
QGNNATGGTATAALAAENQPTATQTLVSTQTQAEAVVETPDEPTRTLEPTMTQTPTLVPTASLVRVNEANVDQIRAEVESVRELEPFEGLDVFLVARAEKESRPLLYDQFDTPEFETAAQDAAQVFNALGFVSEDYDNLENTLNRRVDYLGGVYVPADYRIYIFGLGFSGVEKYIYSYEYTLASVNNQFGISEAGRYPDCFGLDESCMALRALMQGDAALSARLWWSSFAGNEDYEPISQYTPPEQVLSEAFPPAFVLADLKFPYEAGENFVTYLHNYGGWDLVNAAYANPVLTTEQILHPEKYLAGELAIAVADEPLGIVLGDGWQMLADNTLGEWGTFQILRAGWEFSTQLPEPVAKTAAEGWGGDHYQVYVNEDEGTKVLSVHWAWDSQADAAEFTQTFTDYGNRRFGTRTEEAPTGICWEGEEVYSCLLSVGEETLWLLGPDQGTIDILLGLYPDFTNLVIDD